MPAPDITALEEYERDGYVLFPEVLDPGLVQELQRHVAWLDEHHPAERPELYDHGRIADDPFWHRVVADPRLLDIAEQFIGPDIALFASQYIVKPPRTGQAVLLHQDASYWPLEPMEVVSLWVAVDDVDAENGCLRVLPGTHRMDVQPRRARTDVDNVLSSEIAVEVDETDAVDVVLAAGGVEVHHENIVHGSHANTSERRRAGLTIRYIPTATKIAFERIQHDAWPSAFLLRGQAVEGINTYHPRPRYVAGRHLQFSGCEEYT